MANYLIYPFSLDSQLLHLTSDIYKMSPDIHQMYQDIHQMYDTFVNKLPIAHLCSDFQTLYQLQFGVHAVCHVLCAMLCSVQRAMCTFS